MPCKVRPPRACRAGVTWPVKTAIRCLSRLVTPLARTLTDFFTDSPFTVEVERDLSVQQQLLDVVIVRRGRGRFAGRLPDGLEGLRPHNLMTFKSHHEALDAWAMKELVGARRGLPQARQPLADRPAPRQDQFGLYAVAARFPHNLSGQVPWQRRAGRGV